MRGITGNSAILHPLFDLIRSPRQTGIDAVGAQDRSSAVTATDHQDQRSLRPAMIFHHEIALRLRAHFDAILQTSAGRVDPYQDPSAPDQAATNVVNTARMLAEQSDSAPKETLAAVRDAVSAASVDARAHSGVDDDLLGETELRIANGLDTLASDEGLMRATAVSVEAMSKQRSVIRIRTQEGDVVRLDLRHIERMSAEDVSVKADGVELTATGIEVSSRSRLKLVIKGDLNEAEFEAIRDVYAKAESLATKFFGGDMRAALEIAAGLDYDSEQLARVSMRFKSVERINTTMAALQSSPQIAAPIEADADAAPSMAAPLTAPVGATAGAATVVPITPSASDVPDAPEVEQAKPEAAAAPLSEEAPPYGEGFLAGFTALVDYLSQLADYLEDTAVRLSEFAGRFEPDAGSQLKFTQTTQLEILRSVMTVYRPVGEIVAPEAAGDRIAQLDAVVDDVHDD